MYAVSYYGGIPKYVEPIPHLRKVGPRILEHLPQFNTNQACAYGVEEYSVRQTLKVKQNIYHEYQKVQQVNLCLKEYEKLILLPENLYKYAALRKHQVLTRCFPNDFQVIIGVLRTKPWINLHLKCFEDYFLSLLHINFQINRLLDHLRVD